MASVCTAAFVLNGASATRMSAGKTSHKACNRQRASVALAAAALAGTLATGAVLAAPKLPPIDVTQSDRCVPSSSAMGQANAARDKLLDLRECALGGLKFHGDLSGALLAGANLNGADLVGAQLSKAYAAGAQLAGADMTNAIVDRVDFSNADLHDAIFANAVLSDTVFEGANVENVDFTDAYVGEFAQRAICRNPTAKGENPVTGAPTRESLGCR